jgi:hypothetical protein
MPFNPPGSGAGSEQVVVAPAALLFVVELSTRKASKFLHFVRDWYLILLIIFDFEELFTPGTTMPWTAWLVFSSEFLPSLPE